MSVTINDVEKIAMLARLKLTEEEGDNYTGTSNQILEYIEKLNELDTENIEPLSNPVENTNVFRDDKLMSSTKTEGALKNAPDKDEQHFKVPKVINQD